jgi:hypothetical protein
MTGAGEPSQPTRTPDFSQNAREIVTGVISVGIAGLALWMLGDTYVSSKATIFQDTVFSRQKDILLLGLTLLGTVTGYYLGRVPAEKHADAARDAAANAIENEKRVKQQVRLGLDSIEQKRSASGGGVTGDAIGEEINRLRELL